jgi:hypothetical protein
MMRLSSLARGVRLALSVAALAAGLCSAPMVTHGASAGVRHTRAVTTAPVSYHLYLSYISGPLAGRVVDGGIAGTLDSTGTLTATLLATTGATATVMGTVGANTQLTLAGKAVNGTLGGKPTASAGQYSGWLLDQFNDPLASWIITPEPSSPSLNFAGVIRSGKQRGTVLSGTLALAVARSGQFDGTLTLDDGTVIPAAGWILYGNMQLTLYLPHGGILIGVAPKGTINTTGIAQTDYSGTFIGPGTGDHGTWNASQS